MESLRLTTAPPRPVPRSSRITGMDGRATTVHVLELDRAAWTAEVEVLDPVRPLAAWCRDNEAELAMIGGFYIRSTGAPLGEIRTGGRALDHVPFHEPWNRLRACVVLGDADGISLRSRLELGREPGGGLLQAGPMLLRDGVDLVTPGGDPEGFSVASDQFDSDITDGRHPRAALGLSADHVLAVVTEGRSDGEAGLTLSELAGFLSGLGATDAINLDGGGSASLVVGGELVNSPHESEGVPIPGGRAIATALRFTPR